MSMQYLRGLRERELLEVVHEFRPNDRILELGAGSGWQSKSLAERGFSVAAIDVPGSRLAAHRVWPVIQYDGANVPFADQSFDVIFSSNVLEHIPNIEPLQRELHRILKPEGRAVHILPNFGWRFWTNLAHYCHVVKMAARILVGRLSAPSDTAAPTAHHSAPPTRPSVAYLIKGALVPTRHGEFGNCLSELYYFSRLRWSRLFCRTGWHICRRYTNGLWYTGYQCLDGRLSLNTRQKISRVLGAVCHVYVLKSNHVVDSSIEVL